MKYIFWTIISSFLMAPPVLAGGISENLQQTGEAGFGVTGEPTPLPIVVGRIINAFLGLLGILAVVLILYGGYLYMTARGNEQQVEKAKSIIQQAIIGLVIILIAYSIAAFVVSSLETATGIGTRS